MRLVRAQVWDFHSIRNSNEFEIGDITCLVGKNEAGKTAILQSLYRANPIIESDGQYDVTDDYPRWDVEDYRRDVADEKRQPATVITLIYEIEDSDAEAVSEIYGVEALTERTLKVSRGYYKGYKREIQINLQSIIAFLVSQQDLTPEVKQSLSASKDSRELFGKIAAAEQTSGIVALKASLASAEKAGSIREAIVRLLWARVPQFLYFSDYYQMNGCANIDALKQRISSGALRPSDHPLLGLINLARINLDDLTNVSRTRELKNKLEGAGNHLTKKIVRYWSQNKYLQLRFDVREGHAGDPPELRNGLNIWADVYDSKHMVTTELGSRSTGFVWFFSFLSWYSDVQAKGQRVILLLDEPGLSLHAKAQGDLLRYFESEILGHHQLIYTTHSPFMIDARAFERVRIIQDLSIESDEQVGPDDEGSKVVDDVLKATSDSLFPLQGALGYDISQTLFVGPHCLIVEGVSDLLYLKSISELLEKNGRIGLSPNWTITPVGGADKVPTFIALVGSQRGLNVATLIDIQKKDRQTIEGIWKKKLLKKEHVLTFGDFVGKDEADIEDMFEPEFFLQLVNDEYKSSLKKKLTEASLEFHHPRILVRLESYFESNPLKDGYRFSHYRPARFFSENISALEGFISAATLDRFESAFKAANALL